MWSEGSMQYMTEGILLPSPPLPSPPLPSPCDLQALIESLEGKAGKPRMKPPFPADVGESWLAVRN